MWGPAAGTTRPGSHIFPSCFAGSPKTWKTHVQNDVNSTEQSQRGFICVNSSYAVFWKLSFVYNWRMKITYLWLWWMGLVCLWLFVCFFNFLIFYSTGLNTTWKCIFIMEQVGPRWENNCLFFLHASADIKAFMWWLVCNVISYIQ